MGLFLSAGFLTIWFTTLIRKDVNDSILELSALIILNYTTKLGLLSIALLLSEMPIQMTSPLGLTQFTCTQHSSFFIPNIVLYTLPLFKAKTFTQSTKNRQRKQPTNLYLNYTLENSENYLNKDFVLS